MRIALPFQDTPVIKRNKDMRKTLADGGHRRSSSGMRGQRASSLIDDGRGNGTYHATPSAVDVSAGLTPLLAEASAASDVRSKSYKRLSNEALGSPTPPLSDSTSPAQDKEAPCTEAAPLTNECPLTIHFPKQLCLTQRYQPQSSSSTSPQICPSHDGCGVCSVGAAPALCHRNPMRRKTVVRPRIWTSRRCKQVRITINCAYR